MRIARFALVGALLLGASACQTDDGGGVAANIPPLAYVRYINAVPDTFNLTVRWVDQLEFSPMTFVNVPFRGLGQGGYQGLEAGSRHFRVFTYDPALAGGNGNAVTAQLADTTFDFVAGQYYTILHLGYSRTGQTPAQRVFIMNDALPTPTSTQVAVRALNANARTGALDIFATPLPTTALAGAPTFANVAFNVPTGYSNLAVGQFSAQAAFTGTTVSQFAAAAPAGVLGTSAADPIAGATVGASVLTAIALPPAVDGSPAQTYPTVIGNGRTVLAGAGGIVNNAGVWTVTDSVAIGAPGAPNYTVNFCQTSAYRFCRFTITATGLPATSFLVSDNGSNSFTTDVDLTAYAAAAGRKTYTLTAFNSGVVWVSDRQPPRTTTP